MPCLAAMSCPGALRRSNTARAHHGRLMGRQRGAITVCLRIRQTISRLGDQVNASARAWWALATMHSAPAMGLVLVARRWTGRVRGSKRGFRC